MIAVLDASAAIEIVLQRPGSTKLQEHVVEIDWLIAPTLFVAETTNVFWKYQRIAGYSQKECTENLERVISLPDDFSDDLLLYREAFKLGCQLNHAVYDLLYLILARRNDAILLSMDKKLLKLARTCNIETA